jgi:O-antigen ligase
MDLVNSNNTKKAGAVLFGAAAPLLVMGRAEIAVALALASLCFLFASPWRKHVERLKKWRSAPLAVAAIIVLAAWSPGIFSSPDPGASFTVWARTGLFLVIASFCCAAIAGDEDAASLALKSLVAASVCAFAVALAALYISGDVLAYVRLQPGREYQAQHALKSYANTVMLLLPPLVFAAIAMPGRWRMAGGVATLLGVIIVFATHAKSPKAGLLAMVAATAVCLIFAIRSGLVRVMVIVVSLAAAGLLLTSVADKLSKTSERQLANVAAGFTPYLPTVLVDVHRQAIWVFTLDKGLSRPWYGHGINRAEEIQGGREIAVRTGRGRGGENVPSHPHNWLLEIFVETGILGALATAGAVAWFLIGLLNRYFAGKDHLILAVFATSVGYWSSGLFNFSFWSAWWQVAHLVIIAVMLANVRGLPRQE